MNAHPYGCDGYLSTFVTFAPAVSKRYWDAIEKDDLADAARVITEIDMPFFQAILALPGGFDAGLHGVLELAGICQRWRRPPYLSLTDEHMEHLEHVLSDLGVSGLLGQTD